MLDLEYELVLHILAGHVQGQSSPGLNSRDLVSLLMSAKVVFGHPTAKVVDDAAHLLFSRHETAAQAQVPRGAGRWLPRLRELETLAEPLVFSAAGDGQAITDGWMARISGAGVSCSTAVCQKHVMRWANAMF